MSLKDHHVHFGVETDNFPKDNNIVIQPAGQGVLSVHLGFLQVGHRYSIHLEIPSVLCSPCLLQNGPLPSSSDAPLTNPNCHIVQMTVTEDGLQLTIEFFAYKEKIMKEELCLLGKECSRDGIGFKLIFNARVLGQRKGTPLLRNGIRCTAVELEDESEASDWQSFD